jgi:hypothetical protein
MRFAHSRQNLRRSRRPSVFIAVLLCTFVAGCPRLDMYDQPRYEVQESSGFFEDGAASQFAPPGTVARGSLREDRVLYTGTIDDSTFASELPLALTRDMLERGRERYGIFCAVCHDATGTGRGMVVRRGFKQPASFHEPRLRDEPVGYFFDVITRGRARRDPKRRRMTERVEETAAARWDAPPWLDRFQKRALWVGGVGAVVSVLGAFSSPQAFYRAYLVGFLFWLGIPLGCLGISMLQHMTGGGWGLVARRILEAASRTMPLLAVLFVPVALGVRELYSWSRPEVMEANELLQHKQPYLNARFFLARAGLYFVVWWLFAGLLNRWSLQQDRTGNPHLHRRMQLWSSVGLVAYMLTASFAGFDWLMSLDPLWFSSLYGMHFVVGHGVAALAFLIVCARRLSLSEPMSRALLPRHFDDYGKLLLAFVLLWVYVTFSQFLIIWSGNLPEEIMWRAVSGGGALRCSRCTSCCPSFFSCRARFGATRGAWRSWRYPSWWGAGWTCTGRPSLRCTTRTCCTGSTWSCRWRSVAFGSQRSFGSSSAVR